MDTIGPSHEVHKAKVAANFFMNAVIEQGFIWKACKSESLVMHLNHLEICKPTKVFIIKEHIFELLLLPDKPMDPHVPLWAPLRNLLLAHVRGLKCGQLQPLDCHVNDPLGKTGIAQRQNVQTGFRQNLFGLDFIGVLLVGAEVCDCQNDDATGMMG